MRDGTILPPTLRSLPLSRRRATLATTSSSTPSLVAVAHRRCLPQLVRRGRCKLSVPHCLPSPSSRPAPSSAPSLLQAGRIPVVALCPSLNAPRSRTSVCVAISTLVHDDLGAIRSSRQHPPTLRSLPPFCRRARSHRGAWSLRRITGRHRVHPRPIVSQYTPLHLGIRAGVMSLWTVGLCIWYVPLTMVWRRVLILHVV